MTLPAVESRVERLEDQMGLAPEVLAVVFTTLNIEDGDRVAPGFFRVGPQAMLCFLSGSRPAQRKMLRALRKSRQYDTPWPASPAALPEGGETDELPGAPLTGGDDAD